MHINKRGFTSILKISTICFLTFGFAEFTYASKIRIEKQIVVLRADTVRPFPKEFNVLGKHLAETIRYPAAERAKMIVGREVASFKLLLNGRIEDVTIIQSVSEGCDRAVISALHSFKDKKHKLKEGQYKILIDFELSAKAIEEPLTLELKTDPSLIAEVVIYGYSD